MVCKAYFIGNNIWGSVCSLHFRNRHLQYANLQKCTLWSSLKLHINLSHKFMNIKKLTLYEPSSKQVINVDAQVNCWLPVNWLDKYLTFNWCLNMWSPHQLLPKQTQSWHKFMLQISCLGNKGECSKLVVQILTHKYAITVIVQETYMVIITTMKRGPI